MMNDTLQFSNCTVIINKIEVKAEERGIVRCDVRDPRNLQMNITGRVAHRILKSDLVALRQKFPESETKISNSSFETKSGKADA